MAYGARLESVLGASPRGFESPILRVVKRRRPEGAAPFRNPEGAAESTPWGGPTPPEAPPAAKRRVERRWGRIPHPPRCEKAPSRRGGAFFATLRVLVGIRSRGTRSARRPVDGPREAPPQRRHRFFVSATHSCRCSGTADELGGVERRTRLSRQALIERVAASQGLRGWRATIGHVIARGIRARPFDVRAVCYNAHPACALTDGLSGGRCRHPRADVRLGKYAPSVIRQQAG